MCGLNLLVYAALGNHFNRVINIGGSAETEFVHYEFVHYEFVH